MNLNLNIPATNRAYAKYRPDNVADRRTAAKNLMAKYGTEVSQAATLNNVPVYILQAAILIENDRLDPTTVNYLGATGLGQIFPRVAADMIALANRKKLLTADKKAVLRKQLGGLLDEILAVSNTKVFNNDYWQIKIRPALKNAEFNLMVAGIILSLLVREHSASGGLRMDYVLARYNQGYYLLSSRKISKTLPIDGLISEVPAECKNYILKACGRYGWLDILTDETPVVA